MREVNGEASETQDQRASLAVNGKDRVGEGGILRRAGNERPRRDGHRDRAADRRARRDLATALELDGRSRRHGSRRPVQNVGAGELRNECGGGSAVHGRGHVELDDPAGVDDPQAVAEDARVVEGVGDEQGGQLDGREDLRELVADLAPGDRVKRAERFVEQEHLRVAGQGPGQRRALALASGQLRWMGLGQMGDPQPIEQVGPLAAGGEAHVSRDRQVRKQAVVLGQVADAASLGAHVDLARGVEPHLGVEGDLPRVGVLEAGDGTQQRCLAGPRRADQGDRLSGDGQGRANLEGAPSEGDVRDAELHERPSSLATSSTAALTRINSTPIATA